MPASNLFTPCPSARPALPVAACPTPPLPPPPSCLNPPHTQLLTGSGAARVTLSPILIEKVSRRRRGREGGQGGQGGGCRVVWKSGGGGILDTSPN